jgi:ABC-type ATPase involved in cell division
MIWLQPKEKIAFLRRKSGMVSKRFQLLTNKNINANLLFVLF